MYRCLLALSCSLYDLHMNGEKHLHKLSSQAVLLNVYLSFLLNNHLLTEEVNNWVLYEMQTRFMGSI